jgi:hypothetical protein
MVRAWVLHKFYAGLLFLFRMIGSTHRFVYGFLKELGSDATSRRKQREDRRE